jgi:methionine synthase II (cobalamin-independent)
MAESTSADDIPSIYRDKAGFRQLTLDVAHALAKEARAIAGRAEELNVQYLQIDEPSLAFGADLGLACEAVGIVTEAWKQAGGGETILHVCGDVGNIIPELAQMPVDIFNLENVHLREVNAEARQALKDSGKKLALGVIAVNQADVPSPKRVARELAYAWEDYGSDRVWGITPNCGLRLSEEPLAIRRMNCLAEAAREAEALRLELEKWL